MELGSDIEITEGHVCDCPMRTYGAVLVLIGLVDLVDSEEVFLQDAALLELLITHWAWKCRRFVATRMIPRAQLASVLLALMEATIAFTYRSLERNLKAFLQPSNPQTCLLESALPLPLEPESATDAWSSPICSGSLEGNSKAPSKPPNPPI